VLSSVNTVGNYKNKLGGSDYLALSLPDKLVTTNAMSQFVTNTIHVLASDVAYNKGGRWGNWADGGGSSLELVDADADTRQAANWAESEETAKKHQPLDHRRVYRTARGVARNAHQRSVADFSIGYRRMSGGRSRSA